MSIKQVQKTNFIKQKLNPLSEDYNGIKLISKAAFGEVYQVHHKLTQQNRCLKIYNKIKMQNTNQNQFEEELNLIKELDHPNIFKIYEFYQDSENYYLISEYLEGGELFSYISQKKNLDEKTVFIIMEQILSAVNYLHKHNIIHRDLKPENLLLSKVNDPTTIKLIDFGTSKKINSGDFFEIPLGTCYYIAPEVIRRKYDRQADVWSCGIIMYILLVGYPPFNGNTDIEIFKSIVKQELLFDKDDWVLVSNEAKDLIKKMLKKYPVQRIKIEQCINHPWFKKNFETESQILNQNVLTKLKNFNVKSKLEKALRIFLVQFYDIENQQKDLLKFFKDADKNKDGMISVEELKDICSKNETDFDVENFLEVVDLNEDNQVNYSEFLMAAFDFQSNLTRQNLEKVFHLIDLDNNNFITKNELEEFLNVGGQNAIIDQIMKETDANNDGKISLEEFLQSLKNLFKAKIQLIFQKKLLKKHIYLSKLIDIISRPKKYDFFKEFFDYLFKYQQIYLFQVYKAKNLIKKDSKLSTINFKL